MRRTPTLVLLIMALMGLVIQGPANAGASAAPLIGASPTATVPMDCMEDAAGGGECCLSCEQANVACMSGIGCLTVPLLSPNASSWAPPSIGHQPLSELLRSSFVGRSIKPETHPPILMI